MADRTVLDEATEALYAAANTSDGYDWTTRDDAAVVLRVAADRLRKRAAALREAKRPPADLDAVVYDAAADVLTEGLDDTGDTTLDGAGQ